MFDLCSQLQLHHYLPMKLFFSRNILSIDDEGIDLSDAANCADSISNSNVSALSVTSSLSSIINTSNILNRS